MDEDFRSYTSLVAEKTMEREKEKERMNEYRGMKGKRFLELCAAKICSQ